MIVSLTFINLNRNSMPYFLIRITLHKTTNLAHPDYDTLHTEMERRGLAREDDPHRAWCG